MFRGPSFSLKHGSTAFPSGHTTAAFAAATVFAQEYRDRLWVSILSYSAASLIGLSRITENAHWASDVFAGAALGYVTGLQVVRNYHRYAYLKNHTTPVARISWDVQFNYDHIEPARLCRHVLFTRKIIDLTVLPLLSRCRIKACPPMLVSTCIWAGNQASRCALNSSPRTCRTRS